MSKVGISNPVLIFTVLYVYFVHIYIVYSLLIRLQYEKFFQQLSTHNSCVYHNARKLLECL